MKLKLTSLFIFSLLIGTVHSQEEPFPCETDEINNQIFLQFPEIQSKIIETKAELELFTQEYIQQAASNRSDATYIIPVVFHIIHDYGVGNISVEQIYDGLKMVNEQFRKQNADTIEIVDDFKHLASDTKIEFRLAQLDPDGNCTNGINRIYSPLTNAGGHVVKDLIQWPPNKYLNIWVASQAGTSLAGHCLMPPVADTIPGWDGIVIQHSYIGSIGTSSPGKKTVLSHEIGHYLNLYHIWGGNNVPGFYYLPVGDANNCDHDDGVADTPNTLGWNTCTKTGNTCGSLDMVQNYMDYSYCSVLFTEGQKDRMHAALNSSVAGRNNLWSESNLLATGTKDGIDHLCKVDIHSTQRIICVNESITFSDISYNGISSREWTFSGGNITSSTDSTVSVTYNTPGKYDVSLTVSNGSENIDSTFIDFVQVIDNQSNRTYLIDDFESEIHFENKWVIEPSSNPIVFERTNYGKNSNHSISIDNYNGPERANYAIRTPPIDASGMTKLGIAMDYAYAKSSTSINEKLLIQLSKDCGKTWATREQISLFLDFSLESDDEFFPTQNDWIEKVVEINLSNYHVEDLMVRFVFNANKGNNLFIDNINISDISELDLSTEYLNEKLKVYPNPAKEYLNITLEDAFLVGEIQLIDIFGKVVYKSEVNNTTEEVIDLTGYSAGSYFMKYLTKNKGTWYEVRKVIIQ